MRVLASQLADHQDETVVVSGWLNRRRQLKSVSFVILRDRSGLTQVVTDDVEVMAQIGDIPEETVLEITGKVVANSQAPNGFEITDPVIRMLSDAAETPPFEIFRPVVTAGLPVILDHAPVSLRHPRLNAPFRIGAAAAAAFRTTLDGMGFTEIFSPKIVGSATESGANVFKIDYFGRPAYLAQSPQFYKQAMVGVFERVYEIAPVFRAEPHDTARHLAEYVSMDAELGFIGDMQDIMALLRQVIAGMAASLHDVPELVSLMGIKIPDVPETIPSIHFADALDLIAKNTDDDPRGEPDLAPAHERWLCAWSAKEFGSDFLFVAGYPMVKRPFYTHPDPERPDYSNSFDLLFRGQELVTGGQRLHRYSDYVKALDARGEKVDEYESYLATFAHGMPPHGGFAIGLERWVARLIEADNIRYATLFPRDLQRLTP
jgi:nondiscriminating aspartyl-tRNA synthetase